MLPFPSRSFVSQFPLIDFTNLTGTLKLLKYKNPLKRMVVQANDVQGVQGEANTATGGQVRLG